MLKCYVMNKNDLRCLQGHPVCSMVTVASVFSQFSNCRFKQHMQIYF